MFVYLCGQSRAKYLDVAKQMKAYEDVLYEQWRQQVEATLPTLLKHNLLAKPPTPAVGTKPDTGTSAGAGKAATTDGSASVTCPIDQ